MAAPTKKTDALALGARAEIDVADWYDRNGYKILERNWRCFEGELDVIAQKGSTIAICEVKARTSRTIDPALSVSPAKQAKIRTAAFRWLQDNPRKGSLRFDVALVVGDEMQLLRDAF